ncbi:hypothetical protein SUGI_0582870 [Cryptomeria japonica]|uniref:oleosin G n=1 Tax=Cryptomeria japonica TaxID=3369 RepID=UPI002414C515|nr:oleosin G [Cryptomeria japonica]GLJ29552.1 hypothetical protein SUGI_0582870 [Cryptomeria japonica]
MGDRQQQAQQQAQGMMQKIQEKTPNLQQIMKLVGAIAVGGILMVMAGMTFAGTVVTLVCATPVLVFFSPILVPVGIVLFLTMAGFLSAGGFGVAALSALSWIYNYMRGKHPPGSDQVDYARQKIASKARDVKERAKEYGQYVQNKAQEVTQGA